MPARISACFLRFQVAQVGGCLLRTFVDVRSHRTLLQRIAQLGAKKTTRRVAGDTGVETINQIAHHGRVFIDYVGKYLEIVVIDNRVDLSAQGGQLVFDDPANLFYVFVVVNTMAFEIDEEPVFTRVIGEPSLESAFAAAGRANPLDRSRKCADP